MKGEVRLIRNLMPSKAVIKKKKDSVITITYDGTCDEAATE
jgi:hypothetical protein